MHFPPSASLAAREGHISESPAATSEEGKSMYKLEPLILNTECASKDTINVNDKTTTQQQRPGTADRWMFADVEALVTNSGCCSVLSLCLHLLIKHFRKKLRVKLGLGAATCWNVKLFCKCKLAGDVISTHQTNVNQLNPKLTTGFYKGRPDHPWGWGASLPRCHPASPPVRKGSPTRSCESPSMRK